MKKVLRWYALIMLIVYLGAYSFWEHKSAEYWSCQSLEGSSCTAIKPDGSLGMFLFGLVPLAITFLFIVTSITRKKSAGKKRN